MIANSEGASYDTTKIASILDGISRENLVSSPIISDYATVLRVFWGEWETSIKINVAKFELLYGITCNASQGLKTVYVDSSVYLFGKQKITLNGEQEYVFKQKAYISPDFEFTEKPYVKIKCENESNSIIEKAVYPVITLINYQSEKFINGSNARHLDTLYSPTIEVNGI